ncbi:MAG: helix-turn-helix transcriptional regulator [Phycisphaerales bacterium]|nr:helix-turn-helix transcriptional regulator [Phycisphaerales bacterium]
MDSAFIWDTLCDLYFVRITVLSTDGRVVFADDRVEARYAEPGGSVVGKQLSDFVEPKLALELVKIARDVVRSEKPVIVQWVAKGVGICSSVRSLPGSWRGQRLVLVASHDKVCGAQSPPVDGELRVIRPVARDLGPLGVLTRRELQILALIADGMTSAQIAERLARSVKTVEWHRISIGQKLGLKSRIDLAHIGLIAGIGGDLERIREAAGFSTPDDASDSGDLPGNAGRPTPSGTPG